VPLRVAQERLCPSCSWCRQCSAGDTSRSCRIARWSGRLQSFGTATDIHSQCSAPRLRSLARPVWSVAQERHDRGTGGPGYQAEPGNVTRARAGSEPGSDQRDRHSRNLALRYASRSARMGFRSGVRGRVRDSPASDQCTSEPAAGATPGRSRERRGARGGVPR